MNFSRLKATPVARNAVWMLYGEGSRLILQALAFFMLARTLGASEFGALSATAAIASILQTFSGLGSGDVLVMRVSRNPALYPVYFGNALFTTLAFGVPLALILYFVATRLLPDAASATLVAGLFLSESIFGRMMEQCTRALIALERHRYAAHVFVVMSAARAVAVIALAATGGETAEASVLWLTAFTAVACAAVVAGTIAILGRPKLDLRLAIREIRHGVHFSIGMGARTVYTDIDKALLGRMVSVEASGIYTAGYRLVSMSFVPVQALLYAVASRFFQRGAGGVGSSFAWGRRLLPVAVGYGVVAGLGLYLVAPLVPWLLGEGYESADEVIRWLAILPVIQSVHFVLGDTLAGAGLQSVRSAIQIVIAVVSVGLGVWLIRTEGLLGACWASVLSELLLCILFCAAILYSWARESRARHVSPDAG